MRNPVEEFLNRMHHPLLAAVDLSLSRMHHLLSVIGSPHKRLPPVIHVAGTNGKGSLIAGLQAIFEASGYKVHRYISPHLVHFRERIVLAGEEIDDRYLEHLLRYLVPMLSSHPATFFEATTALAFLAFADRKADVLLLETGMGGRLDATNVIDRPALTAITPVSFDHMAYLGNDLKAIAGEKAGIIKPEIACVVGRQEPVAAEVIALRAGQQGAPLYRMGMEWEWSWRGEHAVYASRQRTLAFAPGLIGAYQYDNAATAIACVDQLPQFSVTDAQIVKGLSQTVWPGRLQCLTQGPYRDLLPPPMELWLDGGHNPQGAQVLAAWLAQRAMPVYLICGMIQGKDASGYFSALSPLVRELYAVAIPGETISCSASEVRMSAQSAGMVAFEAGSIESALRVIAQKPVGPAIVCIAGSLYLAGKVLAAQTKAKKVFDHA